MELCVFRGPTPEAAALIVWAHTGGQTTFDGQDLLVSLSERSLIQLSIKPPEVGREPVREILLHDLLNDFARRHITDPKLLHRQLLEAYRRASPAGWASGPNDGYFLQNLAWHLEQAGEKE